MEKLIIKSIFCYLFSLLLFRLSIDKDDKTLDLYHYFPYIPVYAINLNWRLMNFFDDNINDRCWQPADTPEETIKLIENLQPELVYFPSERGDYKELRYSLTSWEGNNITGRRLFYLLKDNFTDKWLGQLQITSDTLANTLRDNYLNIKNNYKFINDNIANMWGCVPTQPFGNMFLGGKLLTVMATNKIIQDKWNEKYNAEMKYIVILSINGRPSQYDSIRGVKALGTNDTGKGVYIIDLQNTNIADIDWWREKALKRYIKKIKETT